MGVPACAARCALVVAVIVAGFAACDDSPTSHDYLAMLYEPARDCLDPSAALATIATGDGSLLCAPTCLAMPSPPAPGASRIYVSTMCGPYPDGLDTSQTDPACPIALAAFARGPDVCAPDGTSSNPVDGGAPDSGSDSASSASDDAADAPDAAPAADDAGDAAGE
jgi:hypothetical protein